MSKEKILEKYFKGGFFDEFERQIIFEMMEEYSSAYRGDEKVFPKSDAQIKQEGAEQARKENEKVFMGETKFADIDTDEGRRQRNIPEPKPKDEDAIDGWISVEKELPKYDTSVLIFRKDKFGDTYIELGEYLTTGKWYKPFRPIDDVTHWMPLPPKPTTI